MNRRASIRVLPAATQARAADSPPVGPAALDSEARAAIAEAVFERSRGHHICFQVVLPGFKGYRLEWTAWRGGCTVGYPHRLADAATADEIKELERAARAEYQRLLKSRSGHGALEIRKQS